MRHSTKVTLITALAFFVVGVLLTSVCLVIVVSTDADLYDDNSREYNYTTEQFTLPELLTNCGANETDTVTDIIFSLQAADVELRTTGGETRLELLDVNLPDYSFTYSGGTFTLTETQKANRFGFYIENGEISFGGLRHIFHTPATKNAPKIILYWNENDILSALRVNVTAGSFDAETVPTNAGLFLTLTYGNTTLKDCISPERALDVRTTAGNISIENCLFETASVNTTCGDLSLTASECPNLQANAIVGSIFFCGSDENATSHIRANTTVGNVLLPDNSTSGAEFNLKTESEYSTHLTTTVGVIHLKQIQVK